MAKRKVPDAFRAAAAKAKAMTPAERKAWGAKMQAARAAKKKSGSGKAKAKKSVNRSGHGHRTGPLRRKIDEVGKFYDNQPDRPTSELVAENRRMKLGTLPYPKECPSCGAPNAPTNKKCTSCGNSMKKKAVALKDPWQQVHSTVRRPIKPARLAVGTEHQTHQNAEGLTYLEWLGAAGLPPSGLAHAAWRAGEDPTEHRAGSSWLEDLGRS